MSQKIMRTGGGSWCLEEDQCTHLQRWLGDLQGKHRAAELTSGPWESHGQVLLGDISAHVKGKMSRCLTNLIVFYDKITGFVNDGESGYLLEL